ncbi:pilus assembly protein TadG-related protein [Flindersiella endophytica]
MRRLTRTNERGAVATVTAVFLAFVVLSAGLITIDVGQLYVERRQLQNGADAAALAVAQSCAVTSTCDPSYAEPYANGNANDELAAVTEVCGDAPGLPGCGAASGTELTNCLEPSGGLTGPYVQVRTATLNGSGSVISSFFGGNDTTVGACARAGWGSVQTATSLALTISLCEWNQATSDGTTYAPPPPYTSPYSSQLLAAERVLAFHSGAAHNTSDCGGGASGWDLPGGFGWLSDTDKDCSATVSAGGTYDADPGTSSSDACQAQLLNAWTQHAIVYVPVYNGQTGNGSNGTYSLQGWAAFVVTGYKFPSVSKKSWLTNKTCSAGGSVNCLSGFFTSTLMPNPISLGGPSMGVSAVALSG